MKRIIPAPDSPEDNPHEGSAEHCFCCGRKTGADPLMIHFIDFGGSIINPTANLDASESSSDHGWFPIGNTCIKKHRLTDFGVRMSELNKQPASRKNKTNSDVIINGKSFDVPKEVAAEFSKMKTKLKDVQDWIDKTDSVVNGCGIEDEYDELFNIMCDDEPE